MIEIRDGDYVSLDEFPLGWRFHADRRPLSAPERHRLRPLSTEAAGRVGHLAANACRDGGPFAVAFRSDDSPVVVLGRLRELPPGPTDPVLVSWDGRTAAVTDWELFVEHWDDFCYPASDDVTILPPGGEWVLCYRHYEVFQFRQQTPQQRLPNA